MIDQREIDLLRSLIQSHTGLAQIDLIKHVGGDAAVVTAVIEALERDGYGFEKIGEKISAFV